MKKLRNRLQLALAVTLVLGACGGKDPATMLASAKGFTEKGDDKAAIIELKSALQEAPDLAEARYLLGKALLDIGDHGGAALELRKALDLHHDESAVVPQLARAMFLQNDLQKLVDQFGQTRLQNPQAQAELMVTLARAYGGLGRRDPARRAAESALAAVADYGPANVLMAQLQADTGDVDGALSALERQLGRTPDDAEAWYVKGDLQLLGKRDNAAALAAYRQAIALKPDYGPAHGAALTILLGNQDVVAAKEQLEALKKILPNHPQTRYFEANLALLSKDSDRARELVQQLLRTSQNNARVVQLAGAVEFERHSWAQAEKYLTQALQLSPNHDATRRLLVLTHLQRVAPNKALAALQPLLDRPDPPAAAYAMAAQAHLQIGDLAEAEAAFEKASRLDPTDARSRTALALSKMMTGHNSAGIAELKRLAASDDSIVADVPLISALVRQKDYVGALGAIDGLEKKQPDKPLAANLRGRVLLAKGDRPGAERAFAHALEIQPSFFPAAESLARLAILDKKPDLAKSYFDGVLKADPANSQALIASAALKVRAGAPREEIVSMFNRAIEQTPVDPEARLALINFQLGKQDFKEALEVAQQAVAALPDNPALLDALGRAQAATGDTNQAVASFNKLGQMVPNSPGPHIRIADLHWSNKNPDAAIQALKRALGIDDKNLAVQRSLVDAYLATEKPQEALAVARRIRQQRPGQEAGYMIEGGIEASRRKWPEAVLVYQAGLKAVPDSSELAARLYVALTAAKRAPEARQHETDWLKRHPSNVGLRFFLGDLALAKKDLDTAERHYREVLRIQPESPLALNNVAWLLARSKRPGAVAMAEKANSLMPDRPVLMDTLALALAAEGRSKEAVDMMRQAVRLDDKNPQFRFNLATLLIAAGDGPAARAELEILAKLGSKFPRQREVTEMLKRL